MAPTANNRIFIAFWSFGLINNILYVIILSAAVDLVGVLVPKATVLLADVLPSFLLKVAAPFFVHWIPYKTRLYVLICLSTLGMLIISLSDITAMRIFGIVLASLSSGLGELTFLQLTHFFDPSALHGFSSGTGAAGLVGSFFFLLFTTWLGISVRITLSISAVVPFIFLWSFGLIEQNGENYDLLRQEEGHVPSQDAPMDIRKHLEKTLTKLQPLVVPYMVPLFTVYFSEYTINQGISPTLLFPLQEMPFERYRDVYVTYGTLYQLGVFVSRSSAAYIRIRNVYGLSILQFVNLVVCIFQSLYVFIPNIWLMMILVFYEGLLGGACYVNTFLLVSEAEASNTREFAMGAVGMSDSAGIVLSALLSMKLEPALCGYQRDHGRPYCQMH